MRKRARGDNDPFWKKLVEVARQADPDAWRNQFRQALLRRDLVAQPPDLHQVHDTGHKADADAHRRQQEQRPVDQPPVQGPLPQD